MRVAASCFRRKEEIIIHADVHHHIYLQGTLTFFMPSKKDWRKSALRSFGGLGMASKRSFVVVNRPLKMEVAFGASSLRLAS